MVNRKSKWIAMALGIVAFLVIGGGVRNTTIINRAMVVGLALDMVDGELEVSSQILVASPSADNQSGSSVISAKGKTISGALDKISKDTSMQVALSHCNLVVVGSSVIEKNAYSILDYLTRNAYLSENALLVTAENGRDILETNVAFSEMASFYAQRAIIAQGEFKGIIKTTIKEFIVNYHTAYGANWLTVIKRIDTQNKEKQQQKTKDKEAQYIFDMSESAIIQKDKYVYTADEDSSNGINYYKGKISRGAISGTGNRGEAIELYILDKKETIKYDIEKKAVTIDVSLLTLIKEIIDYSGMDTLVEKTELEPEETARIEAKIAADINKVFLECKDKGVDIFDVYGGFYRRYGKLWKMVCGENFLGDIKFEVKAKIEFK